MSDFTFTIPSAEDLAKSDAYFAEHLIPKDPVLDAALQNSHKNGLPEIAVSPLQGKFLKLIAQTVNAKRILEVGTLGGYSTIWLARALPDGGKVVTLELSEKHAEVAKQNLNNAGLLSKVEFRVGPAIESLKAIGADQPFDIVFIDADWENMATYFSEAKRLTRKGGVIIVDNINHAGIIVKQGIDNEHVKGIHKLFEQLKNDKDVDATALGLSGVKGVDGILYAVKL